MSAAGAVIASDAKQSILRPQEPVLRLSLAACSALEYGLLRFARNDGFGADGAAGLPLSVS